MGEHFWPCMARAQREADRAVTEEEARRNSGTACLEANFNPENMHGKIM